MLFTLAAELPVSLGPREPSGPGRCLWTGVTGKPWVPSGAWGKSLSLAEPQFSCLSTGPPLAEQAPVRVEYWRSDHPQCDVRDAHHPGRGARTGIPLL